jgi:hypothetical protein
MRRLVLGLVGATMVICACTSGSDGASQASPSIASSPSTVLRVALPTGSSTCGNYFLTVTTVHGTEPLASCAGLAGPDMAHAIRLHVGDDILMTGDEVITWSALPTMAVRQVARSRETNAQTSTAFTMLARGNVTMSAHYVSCKPTNGAQPHTCNLVTLIVS